MSVFRTHPEVSAAVPGLRIVTVVARDLDSPDLEGVERVWRNGWHRVHSSLGYANAQSHPHVAAWRAALKRLGAPHKEFPSSVESLVRRALKNPEPFRVHPLVDFYNAICLQHVVPAGGFDLDHLPAGLDLRRTVPGDSFAALDGAPAEPVPPGEVAYATGSDILTRHLMWRQSRLAALSPSSRQVILVSEMLPGQGDLAAKVGEDLARGMRDLFRATASWAIVDEHTPSLDLAGASALD